MGLLNLFRRFWRFLHPQWTAMTPKQINDIDRAVAESMAKGSFTTKQRPTTAPPTADQLWTGTGTDTSTGAAEYDAHTNASDEYMAPLPNDPSRLWSMSSHGRVSVSSSRGRDSGYAEQRPPSSMRKYAASPQQQQQQQYMPFKQQWGYDSEPYHYDDMQYARPQYPPASYYPQGGYSRAYVPPAGGGDGITAGEPVNAPF